MAYSDDEEREDRFFIAGVDNVGIKRDQYRSAETKRKMLITGGIALGVIAAIALLFGAVLALRHRTHLEYGCPNTDFDTSPDLVFFVVGDWGRQGKTSQQKAANMMQLVGLNCIQPAFIISTGDNFYDDGLSSLTDPQFASSFVNVYTGSALQVPWYAVLGNHDYALGLDDGDVSFTSTACLSKLTTGCFSPLWQVGGPNVAALNVRDPAARWHCQQGAVKRTFLGGLMDIIFIDTNPFIQRYHLAAAANVSGGVASQDPLAQLKDIDALLTNSSAPWKLVVGHHPIYSYGEHCIEGPDCDDMQAVLRPLLRKHKVDAYFGGHDHDMQLIRMAADTTTFVVSGAGSDVRSGEFDGIPTGDATETFLADDQGFVAVAVRGQDMTLYYYASKSREVAWEVTIHQ